MDNLQKAKNYALRLLTYRARSEHEVKLKLKEKGFSQETIAETINFLQEYDFINDKEFARLWLNNRKNLKPIGKKRLQQELKQKGIAGEIIDKTLGAITSEEELEMASKLALKKTAKSPLDRPKLEAFLMRRGFSYTTIKKVIELMPPERLGKW